jgi:exodeoxyribonuclease-3
MFIMLKSFEDDALYRLEIRKKFREMLNLGFKWCLLDILTEEKEGYTFWDYMRGAWQKIMVWELIHFLSIKLNNR